MAAILDVESKTMNLDILSNIYYQFKGLCKINE
jgi:hypothetical protein